MLKIKCPNNLFVMHPNDVESIRLMFYEIIVDSY